MLDFTIAKMNHQMWKRKLFKHISENAPINESEMVSEKDCQLGKWLYSEGLEKYKNLFDIQTLERVHKQLHGLTFEIVKDKKQQNVDAAKKGLEKLNKISDEIVTLLDSLEVEIKKLE